MNDYLITAIINAPATYDEFDGFGDYVNLKEVSVCTVFADSPEQALKEYGFIDKWDMTFYATQVIKHYAEEVAA